MTLDELLALAERCHPWPGYKGLQPGQMEAYTTLQAALSPERVKALVEVAKAAAKHVSWYPSRPVREALANLDREMGESDPGD